jgi:hypothetical protein
MLSFSLGGGFEKHRMNFIWTQKGRAAPDASKTS